MNKDRLITIFSKIAKPLLSLIYFFFKLFPSKNKITLISRQSNTPSIDFKLIQEYIDKNLKDWRVVVLTKTIKKDLWHRFLYMFEVLRQMYHIATSKGVILDTYCIPISLLKHKKDLVVIQMWHAMGALKKFGYSILDKEEGSSSIMAESFNMHNGYTYVLSSSEFTKPFFAEAFNVDISKIKAIPLPRVELLNDKEYIEKRKKELEYKYPILKEKQTIAYVPTFRKDETSRAGDIINNIDKEKYNLIVKEHPLTEKSYKTDDILDFTESSLDPLIISDYIITDYSAIVFEASLLLKPLYFYAYDLNEYIKKRDFYIDYEKEMPGLISDNVKDIINGIENNNYDLNRIKEFRDKYINIKSSKEEIIKLIIK